MKTAATTTRVDLTFRAFSDRTRLRILNLLRSGELSVCDLINVIGAPQAKISRHLAYLRKAGLVRSSRGPRGGHELAREPGAVAVGEIIARHHWEDATRKEFPGAPACLEALKHLCELRARRSLLIPHPPGA